jgi:hypothetical protein
MTEEQKNLLMRDLCARLPYGVKCIEKTPIEDFQDKNLWEIDRIRFDTNMFGMSNCYVCYGQYEDIHNIKPYLFPLSSMTEEQKEEHKDLLDNQYLSFDANGNLFTLQDFYCKYHLDYRGFIPDGLAEDATGKNIY